MDFRKVDRVWNVLQQMSVEADLTLRLGGNWINISYGKDFSGLRGEGRNATNGLAFTGLVQTHQVEWPSTSQLALYHSLKLGCMEINQLAVITGTADQMSN